MRVQNIHQRTISQPKAKVWLLMMTLSSDNDLVWPKEHWPGMKLDKGLVLGARGGHGPIGYFFEHPISFSYLNR